MIGPELWDAQFWAQFWPNLIATFAGVGLALLANRIVERFARRAEEENLLRSINHNLMNNVAILVAVEMALEEKGKAIPTNQFDVASLDALFPRFAQVSPDTELTTLIAVVRHLLHHFNTRLERFLDIAYTLPDERDVVWDITQGQRLGAMAKSIASNLPNLERVLGDALRRIHARLGTALPMAKKPTLTEQEAHALIVEDARYRQGCAEFTPVFTLRRAEPDASGRFPRANWDVDEVEGADTWQPECRQAFREAVLRNRGKYDVAWAR